MAENDTFSQEQLEQVSLLPASILASEAFLSFARDIENGDITNAQRISGFDLEMLLNNYVTGLERERMDPNIVLGAFTANDFAGTKYITQQNNPGADQSFLQIIARLNDLNEDTANALAIGSAEARQIFERNNFNYTLPEPELNPQPQQQPQAPSVETDIIEQETTEPEITEPEIIEPEPEPETAEPETKPETTAPPPGSRGNPIQPRIEIETPAISYAQIMESVQGIQAQLENLPDDPAQRQTILNGISDAMEEMAITLTPSAENDGRLNAIPPRATDATFDRALESLGNTLNTISKHDDTSALTEYLVRGSQQAAITAREAGELIAPEIEAAPAEVDAKTEATTETEAATPESDPSEPSYADIIKQGMERTRSEREAERAATEEAEPENAAEQPTEDPVEAAPAETAPASTPEPTEAEPQTELRLSEFLDGRGHHNDSDGYTDYNALEGAFSRAAELGITTEHIENIRLRINSPEFILQTSAAISALDAYNQGVQAAGEQAGLTAFFNAISPEDFVRDLENSVDDNSVYEQQERDQVREATLRIENMFKP